MKLTELALLSLQTAYMQRDLTTQGMCKGVQHELREAATSTYNILMYQTLDRLEDTKFGNDLVNELAWQFHVDYYDHTAEFEVRKALVKQSIQIHRKKGTPQAVMDLLNTAFPTHTILMEWFNYGGEPYHFKIVTSSMENVDEASFLKALGTVQNIRSRLDGISVFTTVLNVAINNIQRATVIEYRPNICKVGEFMPYTAKNGDAIMFGTEEYGFYKGV